MTIPGAGGQVPPRPDQAYTGSSGQAAVSPGGGQVIRARQVVVSGPDEGVFSYSSSPPAFGTLISTAGIAMAGTDPYGNAYLAGTTSYQAGGTYFATSLNGGFINFYTAPGAGGPWTFQGSIIISMIGPITPVIVLNFPAISGAINAPQPAIAVSMPIALPPPATYNQLYIGGLVAAVNDIYAGLQSANIFL